MQGKIFFSLNTFQISDLWFSNCEGEKWKRGRYWGRKLAYLVILPDVWPVPTNGWILLPRLMRLQVCRSPWPSQSSPLHSKAWGAHPITICILTILHHCARFQRVTIPKAPLKIPQVGTEHRAGTPKCQQRVGWVTEPRAPQCWVTSPGMVASSKPHIRTRQVMSNMEMGKKNINFYTAIKMLTSLP